MKRPIDTVGDHANNDGIHPSRKRMMEHADRRQRVEADRRDRFQGEPFPELYSIHKATVRSVKDYGAFLELEGFKRNGLLHVSNISKYRVDSCQDVLDVGESCWVKVIEVDESNGGRIALAMKYCNQRDGNDLDVHNIELQQQKQGCSRRSGSHNNRQAGDAVLNNVCSRCKRSGHLVVDCRVNLKEANSSNYSLLEQNDDELANLHEYERLLEMLRAKEAEKKQKKLAKQKKKKK